MFYHNSNLRFADIRDGASQTIMVGERNSEIDYSTWVGVVHGVKFAIPRIVATTERPPNQPNGSFEQFSSHHPGATQFLFSDGAVHAIADDVDAAMFRALGTRAGKEVVSGGVYQ